jgi:hypothetical protein
MLDHNVSSYSVLEAQDASDGTDLQLEERLRVGYAVLHSGVAETELDDIHEWLDNAVRAATPAMRSTERH